MRAVTKENPDSREPAWAKQRKLRGFDDRETWSLDNTIAKFVLPRLKRFVEIGNGYPGSISEAEWNTILHKIIQGFELLAKGAWTFNDRERKQADEALKLFAEWYTALWW